MYDLGLLFWLYLISTIVLSHNKLFYDCKSTIFNHDRQNYDEIRLWWVRMNSNFEQRF